MNIQLPPLLPYPSDTIRQQLLPEEWSSCLDLWITSIELRLGLADSYFVQADPKSLGIQFLSTYFSTISSGTKFQPGSKEERLYKICFHFCNRLISTDTDLMSPALLFQLLSGGSNTFENSKAWRQLLKSIWKSRPKQIRKAIESGKSSLASAESSSQQQSLLDSISALTKCLPETSTVTVASADYLDTLSDIYKDSSAHVKQAITRNIYYSFSALLSTKHITILTDNIYHMKSEADHLRKTTPATTTILSSLLCSTTFLRHMRSNPEIITRKHALIDQLTSYRHDTLHLHPPISHPRKKKGKERAPADGDMHMHQAALVSQVHELFPDLSTSYIIKALDFYSDNVENVIAALLEPTSLPPVLQNQTIPEDDESFDPGLPDLEPRSTPPSIPERRTVFDNDAFDQLSISSSQLHRGKRNIDTTPPVDSNDHARSKAAILSALAAFDSDDDERDDSYDVADVGASVDTTLDTDERRSQDVTDSVEGALFTSWKENPELFARDSKTRSSNIRQQLKRETNMTDEQIEGWAVVLSRDKKLQDRLQDKYSSARAFSGQQKALQSTKWQASTSTDNSENESGPERSNDSRRIGQVGIRGHRDFGGRGGRGRGSSTSGPSGDAATQQARKRKEQGRGRGGGGQRRDARAKKIGRGMGPLPEG